MTKFIRTFEDREIKNELHFGGEVFMYTMKTSPYGKEGDAPAFDVQLESKYGSDDEEMLEAANQLDFGNDDEIEEALAVLHEAERYIPKENTTPVAELEKILKGIQNTYDAYAEEMEMIEESDEGILDVSVLCDLADSIPYLLRLARKMNRIEEEGGQE